MSADRHSVLRSPAGPAKTVAYTGTAGQTGTFNPNYPCVLVWCTTAAYVIVGESVTATATNGTPIPANTPMFLPVPEGTGAPWLVSAIQIASGGNLYAQPFA